MKGRTGGWRSWGAALAAAAAMLLLTACGDDEETTPTVISADEWAVEASAFCGEGRRKATKLPLPTSKRAVAPDAELRVRILTKVRGDIIELGRPEDVNEVAYDAYLTELESDIDQLQALAAGDDAEPLDESAGQAALELELDECAAFANAIARTP